MNLYYFKSCKAYVNLTMVNTITHDSELGAIVIYMSDQSTVVITMDEWKELKTKLGGK